MIDGSSFRRLSQRAHSIVGRGVPAVDAGIRIHAGDGIAHRPRTRSATVIASARGRA